MTVSHHLKATSYSDLAESFQVFVVCFRNVPLSLRACFVPDRPDRDLAHLQKSQHNARKVACFYIAAGACVVVVESNRHLCANQSSRAPVKPRKI